MFCELTIFLCFTESNIVCGEGKGHTETISPSVLSVLIVFKAGQSRHWDKVDSGTLFVLKVEQSVKRDLDDPTQFNSVTK